MELGCGSLPLISPPSLLELMLIGPCHQSASSPLPKKTRIRTRYPWKILGTWFFTQIYPKIMCSGRQAGNTRPVFTLVTVFSPHEPYIAFAPTSSSSSSWFASRCTGRATQQRWPNVEGGSQGPQATRPHRASAFYPSRSRRPADRKDGGEKEMRKNMLFHMRIPHGFIIIIFASIAISTPQQPKMPPQYCCRTHLTWFC